jgi:hypothetical protein
LRIAANERGAGAGWTVLAGGMTFKAGLPSQRRDEPPRIIVVRLCATISTHRQAMVARAAYARMRPKLFARELE